MNCSPSVQADLKWAWLAMMGSLRDLRSWAPAMNERELDSSWTLVINSGYMY